MRGFCASPYFASSSACRRVIESFIWAGVTVGADGLGAIADDWAMAFSLGTSGAAAVQRITSKTRIRGGTISPWAVSSELRAKSEQLPIRVESLSTVGGRIGDRAKH